MKTRALGLMSGTSMDGIDLAMIETDGELITSFGKSAYRPYSVEERAILRRALTVAREAQSRDARPEPLRAAEDTVTAAHAAFVDGFLRDNGLTASDVDVIGFHGQTVFHAPDRHLTIQLGDGARLARETGIEVVYDMRADDVAAGGEGAPLAPVFHQALAAAADLPRPLGVLNLGGVANITWIGPGDDDLLAFDTGPANALLDDFIQARTGNTMDEGGRIAAAGRIHEDLVARWLDIPFFDRPAPKSLDRDAFVTPGLDALSTEDGAATLTAFTAATIAKAYAHLLAPPALLVASGGGARNPELLRQIAERTGTPVRTASDVGWSADFIEAQAFAFMAVRALNGKPITFPGTTGVDRPMTGGRVARPVSDPA